MKERHQDIINSVIGSAQELLDILESVPESAVHSTPAEGQWSIFEIVVHVRNVALFAYGLRLRRLVFETDPHFANYDEDDERLNDMRKGQSISEVAGMIAAEHRAISQLLSLLSEEAWLRTGLHPQSGALSIEFLAKRLADHAEEHIQQIKDTNRAISSR